MLRFALIAAIAGLTAATGVLVANQLSPIETPEILVALFVGVFVAFVPAVLGHPKSTAHGTTVSVDPRHTLRSAPWWSTAILAAAMGYLLFLIIGMGEQHFGFGTRADLVGHPERVRFVAAMTNVFYAAALHVALSGMKLERDFLDAMRNP